MPCLNGSISNSSFLDNVGAGILCDNSPLLVDQCLLSGNSNAITLVSSGTNIVNCEISNNIGGNGVGFLLVGSDDAVVDKCLIYGNQSLTT